MVTGPYVARNHVAIVSTPRSVNPSVCSRNVPPDELALSPIHHASPIPAMPLSQPQLISFRPWSHQPANWFQTR